jgi:hypothetical protein
LQRQNISLVFNGTKISSRITDTVKNHPLLPLCRRIGLFEIY